MFGSAKKKSYAELAAVPPAVGKPGSSAIGCDGVVGRPVPTVHTPRNTVDALVVYSWLSWMPATRQFVGAPALRPSDVVSPTFATKRRPELAGEPVPDTQKRRPSSLAAARTLPCVVIVVPLFAPSYASVRAVLVSMPPVMSTRATTRLVTLAGLPSVVMPGEPTGTS